MISTLCLFLFISGHTKFSRYKRRLDEKLRSYLGEIELSFIMVKNTREALQSMPGYHLKCEESLSCVLNNLQQTKEIFSQILENAESFEEIVEIILLRVTSIDISFMRYKHEEFKVLCQQNSLSFESDQSLLFITNFLIISSYHMSIYMRLANMSDPGLEQVLPKMFLLYISSLNRFMVETVICENISFSIFLFRVNTLALKFIHEIDYNYRSLFPENELVI